MSVRAALSFILASLVVSSAANGAAVEVSVSERGAGPVVNQAVAVVRVTGESALEAAAARRPAGRCTTDARGICTVGNLAPGVYTADVRPLADPNLSVPSGPAAIAFGTVTLAKQDATARLTIALERGIRVIVHAATADGRVPDPMRVEVTRDDGARWERRLDAAGNADVTLGSGRFTAHLVPPDGPILVGVTLDGDDLVTPDVAFELSPPGPDRFVTWTLSATCYVDGTVHSTRPEPGVSVRAELLEAAAWGQSALCRATPCAGSPVVRVHPDGRYFVTLPSGRWRLRPVGDSLIASTPPYVDVALSDGEAARADFDVQETEADGGPRASLFVRVRSPEGADVGGARVELWPPDGDAARREPLRAATTGPWHAPAMFEKVAGGSYLVRARAAGYVPAVVPLADFDPSRERVRWVTIELGRGATIDASVRDAEGNPATGVALEVARTDEPEATDPAARLARGDDRIATPPSNDQTGHIVVTGLTAGSYRVTPSESGAAGARTRLTIAAPGEKGARDATVALGPDDRADLDVRVLPAAFLTARLACADGRPIPRRVVGCVVGPTAADDVDPAEACHDRENWTASVALSGDAYDTLAIGPLEAAAVRLALRPEGYDGWTWALGTPDARGAARIPVDGAGPIDLGSIPVLCGPAIELRPKVGSGDPLPDLRDAKVEGTLTRPAANGETETRAVAADRYRDRVVFRELPERTWTLAATISHPYFVPAAPVSVSLPVTLERGKLTTSRPAVPAVGGAIVVRGAPSAARISSGSAEPRIVASTGGVASFAGVPPGTYRVDVCGDAGCASVTQRRDAVAVQPGRTVEVGESGAGPAPSR